LATSKHDWKVRLIARNDRNNRGLRLTYSPLVDNTYNSDWRRYLSISDSQGATALVAWNAAQVGGKDAIDHITMPDGTIVSYVYAGGFLSGVQYPDGAATTITRSVVDDFTAVAIQDAGAETTHRNKTAYFSNEMGYALPSQGVKTESAARLRKLKNGAGEWSYWSQLVGTAGNQPVFLIYEGGNQLRKIQLDGPKYVTSFTYTPDTNGGFSSALQLNTTLDASSYQLSWGSGTYAKQRNQPAQLTSPSGISRTRTYTASGKVHSDKRGDSAVTVTTYNQFDQPLTRIDPLGRSEAWTYDAQGNELTHTVAIGTAVQATTTRVYYPAGHQNQYLLWKRIDANGNETEFVYDVRNRLIQRIDPADDAGVTPRPITQYGYDSANRLTSVTEAGNRRTDFQWDVRGRLSRTDFADSSYEQTVYYTTESGGLYANLVKSRRDRNGNVESCTYDAHGRKASCQRLDAAAVVLKSESWTYLSGSELPTSHVDDGETTTFAYDHRNRQVSVTRYPTAGVPLSESTAYAQSRPSIQTDAYGRRTFLVYAAATGNLVRAVRELVPGGVPTGSNIATLPRISTANPPYVIEDMTYDAADQLLTTTDPRGVVTRMTYDGQGRMLTRVEADGTPEAATTSMTYDAQGNVIELTNPRGMITRRAYTGRNLTAMVTEGFGATNSAGQSIAATTTYAYSLTGKVATVTDTLGRATTTEYSYIG
jgi:YD repeat-containing protein